jgi:hypothetical protein
MKCHQKVQNIQVIHMDLCFFNNGHLEIFPNGSTNARNTSKVANKTHNICTFLGSADPTFLVPDKLETSLQDLISSEDTCQHILHGGGDGDLRECSTQSLVFFRLEKGHC